MPLLSGPCSAGRPSLSRHRADGTRGRRAGGRRQGLDVARVGVERAARAIDDGSSLRPTPIPSPTPEDPMADILKTIEIYKRAEIEVRCWSPPRRICARRGRPPAWLSLPSGRRRRTAGAASSPRSRRRARRRVLIRRRLRSADGARLREESGAACLSVLDPTVLVPGALEFSPPRAPPFTCIRKDFLFEPYQVLEARAWGADCILIIMASFHRRRGSRRYLRAR